MQNGALFDPESAAPCVERDAKRTSQRTTLERAGLLDSARRRRQCDGWLSLHGDALFLRSHFTWAATELHEGRRLLRGVMRSSTVSMNEEALIRGRESRSQADCPAATRRQLHDIRPANDWLQELRLGRARASAEPNESRLGCRQVRNGRRVNFARLMTMSQLSLDEWTIPVRADIDRTSPP